MMPRRLLCSLSLLLFGLGLCAASRAQPAARPDSAALITRLGVDTLSVERWVRTADGVAVEAAVRAPHATFRRYTLDFAPDGTVQRYAARIFDPANLEAPVETEVVERTADGWTRTVTAAGTAEAAAIEADAALLPFVDLLFWPYELVLLRGADETARTQPLLGGTRAMPFTVERTGPDQVTVTHPWRGPSVARVDAQGRLLALDASETTRKVQVTRVPWGDAAAHARRWARADEAGRGLGELSGRAEAEAEVAGAHLAVDYGTPSRRGREIFGHVVPWNELWRTGANRATHFTTDRTLVLGDPAGATVTVPPGTYTLFTIPAPDGGTLIVNRQTGQGGTTYDAEQDLGRVPMRRLQRDDRVERFTIAVEPQGTEGGTLHLRWDRSDFVVPFTVR